LAADLVGVFADVASPVFLAGAFMRQAE